MNPFSYPKVKVLRTQTPPQYTAYKRYKPFLQVEFGRQCVYCRMPDTTRENSFGADHYRPKSIFPALSAEYSNLYYCCNQCNARKGDYWEPNAQLSRFVPNPCEHVMWDHLRFKGGNVDTRTNAGRFTAEFLDLNDPDAVRQRESVIHLIDLCTSSIRDGEKTVDDIEELFKKGAISQKIRDDEVAIAKGFIAKSKSSLGTLIPM
jgi:hypothetical protein